MSIAPPDTDKPSFLDVGSPRRLYQQDRSHRCERTWTPPSDDACERGPRASAPVFFASRLPPDSTGLQHPPVERTAHFLARPRLRYIKKKEFPTHSSRSEMNDIDMISRTHDHNLRFEHMEKGGYHLSRRRRWEGTWTPPSDDACERGPRA